MKMKRIFAFVLCMAVLFAMSALTSCKKNRENEQKEPTAEEIYRDMTPEQKLTASLLKTGESVQNWEEVAELSKVLDAAVQSGSVQFEATLNESITGQSEPISLRAKIWETGTKYALKLNAGMGEESISADAYIDPTDRIVIGSEELLGGTYGIDLTNFADVLGALISGTDEGSSMNQVMDAYTSMIPAVLGKIPELLQKREALTEQIGSILLSSVVGGADISVEAKTVSSMDREINAYCIAVRIDNEGVAKMLHAFYQAIKDNPEFSALLDEMISAVMSVELPGAIDGTENLPVDAELSIEQEINEAIDEIKDAEPFEFKLVISTDATGSVVRLDTELEVNGMPIALSLELAGFEEEFSGCRLTAVVAPQVGVQVTVTVNVSVEKTEHIKTIRFNTTGLAVTGLGDFSGSFTYDKETGNVQIRVEQTGILRSTVYEIGFLYKIGDGVFMFGRPEFKQNGTVLSIIPDFLLTVREKDDMPAAPEEYVNILGMSEFELDAFMEDVQTRLAPYAGMLDFLGGMFDPWGNDPDEDPDDDGGVEWNLVTEPQTPDQAALIEQGYEVWVCPESELDSQARMFDMPEGTVVEAICGVNDEGAIINIYRFVSEEVARECYEAWWNRDSYRLEGAKMIEEFIPSYHEDEDDPTGDDDDDSGISGETEWGPALVDCALLESNGYIVYISVETTREFETQFGVEENSMPCAVSAMKENGIFIYYFTSSEQAQICYDFLSAGDETSPYKLIGAKVVYGDLENLIQE